MSKCKITAFLLGCLCVQTAASLGSDTAAETNKLKYLFGTGNPLLVCAPLQICTIELEPGEKIQPNGLHLGDTARWKVNPAVGANDTTILFVKPLLKDLNTTMVIATTKRIYHLTLQSKETEFMPGISWFYPQDEIKALKALESEAQQKEKENTLPNTTQRLENLNFNYHVSDCRRCKWRPVRIYDDSNKVYIEMPWKVGKSVDLPVLFVESSGIKSLVNYRFINNRYVVHQLFTSAVLTGRVNNKYVSVRIKRL